MNRGIRTRHCSFAERASAYNLSKGESESSVTDLLSLAFEATNAAACKACSSRTFASMVFLRSSARDEENAPEESTSCRVCCRTVDACAGVHRRGGKRGRVGAQERPILRVGSREVVPLLGRIPYQTSLMVNEAAE